jgi:hypothetical protein
MSLSDEFRDQICAFLDERIDADALFGWLTTVLDEVDEANNADLRAAWNQAFLLLSELSSGDRTEASVRSELNRLVQPSSVGAS